MKPTEGISVDVFWPDGRLRYDLLDIGASNALNAAIRLAAETRWDRLRSPHIFMGLLAAPDTAVNDWGRRLGYSLPKLLEQFQELFEQRSDPPRTIHLNREFLSDNAIRLIRDARSRAHDQGRTQLSGMDLLICLLTAPKGVITGCFEHIGITAAKLTEWAVLAEQFCGNAR